MKLTVEYEPQFYVFDIDDDVYSDYLGSGLAVTQFFADKIAETSPEYNVRLVSLVG